MIYYFPCTCDIITVGHIKCLENLNKRGIVIVGLLTTNALRGYKKEIVPFRERLYILKAIARGLDNVKVVPQETLSPEKNLIKYKCNAIVSGDGWEESELSSIKKLGIKPIDLKLKGEKFKKYSSSNIKQKIWRIYNEKKSKS